MKRFKMKNAAGDIQYASRAVDMVYLAARGYVVIEHVWQS